jgi:hypothetical protein
MRYENFRAVMLRTMRGCGVGGCGALLILGLTITTGCGSDTAKKPAEKPAAKAEHHEEDGHKTGEAGHKAGEAAHAHAEEGPHKGHLIELGKEEYHGELLHDDAAHKITIYLLDGEAKKGIAIAEKELTLNVVVDGKPSQFKLPAVSQSDDLVGQSSRFELVDHNLCEALDNPKCKGRLNVTIAGKQFSGEVAHEEHADHK